tara:strand:+ start:1961 stop:2566 length:606 start_codon:yes stop_codon:yes gene_type:complete
MTVKGYYRWEGHEAQFRAAHEKMLALNKQKGQEGIERFEAGIMLAGTPRTGNKVSEYLRDYLFDKANYACSICGYNNLNIHGKPNLQISHCDDWSDNGFSWNLEVICPNCHTEKTNFGYKDGKRGRMQKRNEKGHNVNVGTNDQAVERIQAVLDYYSPTHPELIGLTVDDVLPIFTKNRRKPEIEFAWGSKDRRHYNYGKS